MSLITHWPLDGHVEDVVGARHGSLSGGLGYANGLFGQALHFTNDNHQVTIPHDDVISAKVFGVSTTFSFTCWFKPEQYQSWGCIIAKANDTSWSNTTAGIWVYASGIRAIVGINQHGNPNDSSRFVEYAPPLNVWAHLAVLADGEKMTFYVNGINRGSVSILNLGEERSQNNDPITIGPRYDGISSELRGLVQDIKIYDHCISKLDVINDAMGPVAKYDFLTGNLGSSIRGISTGTNHGTVWSSTLGRSFNGIDDYISLDPRDFITTEHRGTWSIVFKTDDPNKNQIVGYCKRQRDRGIAIHNGRIKVGMYTGAWRTLDGGVATDKEHHVSLCWDDEIGLLKCYVDGILMDSLSVSPWSTTSDNYDVRLGDPTLDTNWLMISGWFVGTIKSTHVYGTIISDDDAWRLSKTVASIHDNGCVSLPYFKEEVRRTIGRGGVYSVSASNIVVAYEDNTVIYLNGVEYLTLSKGEIQSISIAPGDLITSNGKPFTTGTSTNGVPMSWASRQLLFRVDRYASASGLFVISPHGRSHVKIYRSDDLTSPIHDVYVDRDNNVSLSTDVTYNYLLESDLPVCLYATSNGDYRPVFPPTMEIYGTPSSNADIQALEDGTELTIYRSDGSVKTATLNKLKNYQSNGTGNQFHGASELIVSNKPIAANSQADSDGGDATPYVSRSAMSTDFILPDDSEWVKLVGYTPGATVEVYDPTGTLTQTLTVNSAPGARVTELRITGNPPAGTKLVCSHPQSAVMEKLSNDDETILYGTTRAQGLTTTEANESKGVVRGRLNEVGLLDAEYHAWYRMDFTPRDVGPHAFDNAVQNLVLTDRGFEFNKAAIVSYIEAMSVAQTSDLIGDESDGITIVASFESREGGNGIARVVSRDASDYWAIAVYQNQTFPQELRVYSHGGDFFFPGKVTPGWHRIVFVRDVSNGVSRLWFDGEYLGSKSASPHSSARGITIGANEEGGPNPSSASYWKGRIEDVRLIKGVVSETSVKEDYRQFVKRGRTFSKSSNVLFPNRLIEV